MSEYNPRGFYHAIDAAVDTLERLKRIEEKLDMLLPQRNCGDISIAHTHGDTPDLYPRLQTGEEPYDTCYEIDADGNTVVAVPHV